MYALDYFKDSLFNEAAVIKGAQAEGISGHAAALRWTMYHSALKPEYGDAVVIGVLKAEQLSQNLDYAEAGPLSASLAQKSEEVWKSSKKDAPNQNSFFNRGKEGQVV